MVSTKHGMAKILGNGLALPQGPRAVATVLNVFIYAGAEVNVIGKVSTKPLGSDPKVRDLMANIPSE